MSNAKKVLGARIAELRKNRNLTQLQLSELIGIAPTTLTNIELGKRFLTAPTLDKIKKVLGVEYKDLFDLQDNNDDIESNYNNAIETINYLYKNHPSLIPAANSFLELLKQ